jgi:hypothetical protein
VHRHLNLRRAIVGLGRQHIHAQPTHGSGGAASTERPAYRVNFYDSAGASDEYEVTGADVDEVLDWANAHADGRMYVAYALVLLAGERPGLVRLVRCDPNEV